MSSLFTGVAPFNRALDYHLERHNVLATNIAHVDTPRYKPSDLARIPENGFANVMHVTLQRTNGMHMATGAAGPMVGQAFQDLSAGGGPDGNFVSIDREAAKLAANKVRYDVVSVLIKSELDGLMRAAADGQG